MNHPFLLCLLLLAGVRCGSGAIHTLPDEDGTLEVRLGDVLRPGTEDGCGEDHELRCQEAQDVDPSGGDWSDPFDLPSDSDTAEDRDVAEDDEPGEDTQEETQGGSDSQEFDLPIVYGPFEHVEVEHEGQQEPWDRVLLLTFAHPGLSADAYNQKTSRNDPSISGLFKSTQPPASSVLLHVGPDCQAPQTGVTLFVHGVGSDANQTWMDPPWVLGKGIGRRLMEKNRCVMAVTFPHAFGDNVNQAIQLAAAVQKAREITQVPAVGIVAHSKGGIAAVTWLSGFAAQRGLPYEGGVSSVFLVGVPLGGMDFSFRHPAFNYPAHLLNLSLPSSWDQVLEWSQWRDIFDDSIYASPFRGVAQLTVALDEQYPLSMVEQDWYTTYYGGTGFVSHSHGIAYTIELGDYFMEHLSQHKTPADLPVYLASGGNSIMGGVVWEASGVSDGMVFRSSAETTSSVGWNKETRHYPLLNHVDLLVSSSLADWILDHE